MLKNHGIERFKNGIGKNDRHKVKASSLFNNNPPKEDYFNELFRISNNQIVFGANNFTMPPSEYFLIWNMPLKEQYFFLRSMRLRLLSK